jgi:tRNA A-37 threonylcarbamoyl transferase component Bud32
MTADSHGRESSRGLSKPAPAWLGKKVGRFRLLASIGQGAMGRVFRAEDTSLNRQVALKILPNKVKRDDEEAAVEQFIREARSAATLEHPNVVHIYEVNQTEKLWYIAMELLEGGNLRELVKANGPLDMFRACQVCAEAGEALDYAHGVGIVHRDVKPANLMLTRSGRCKLTDFGLARIDDANDPFHMGTENVGTPLYAAPEISQGNAAQPAADIYSLGCTLYYLLTGTPPYQAKTVPELLQFHQSAPPPDLCEIRPDLPGTLAQVIIRAMAKDPDERFESAGQFAKVLRMHTIPVSASGSSGVGVMTDSGAPMGVAETVSHPSRRLILWGSLAAVVLLSGGIFAAVYFGSRAGTPPMLAAPPMAAAPIAALPAAVVATPEVEDRAPAQPAAALDVSLVPSATFQATDTNELLAIAKGKTPGLAGKTISVVGQISSIHPTSAGKNMRIDFVGTDTEDGFCATCPLSMAKQVQQSFTGQQVRIIGIPELHKSRPEIRVDSIDQIQTAQVN